MLSELRSTVLRKGAIRFHKGLNVVLGDENGTNSIGKSTLLMLIDFGLGGSALLEHNTDLVAELGHHDYFFAFAFDDIVYWFRRGTFEPSVVYACDDDLAPVRAMDLEEYTAFLMQAYEIDLPFLSFRALVGLYLRVWGKDNLSVERPLHVVQAQPATQCVDTLLKVFARYSEIHDLAEALNAVSAQQKALKAAAQQDIIPSIGKREYVATRKRLEVLESDLEDIRKHLARYATNLSEIVNRDVLELKVEKDDLLRVQLALGSQLKRVQRNLQEDRHVKGKHFDGLVRFFPDVNRDRLVEVEEFHNGVARLLRAELKDSELVLQGQLQRIDATLASIDQRMASALGSIDQPVALVDKVVEVAVAIQEAQEKSDLFEHQGYLKVEAKELRTSYTETKMRVLKLVSAAVNDGMRRIVTSVFGQERKSPQLALHEASYTFEVFEDTGTGTAYASLIILDLAIFLATELPVIAHDSLLFKNVENDSVAKLLAVYETTDKQSFVALDEIEKYGVATAQGLRNRSVVQLDNEEVLFVRDWRV